MLSSSISGSFFFFLLWHWFQHAALYLDLNSYSLAFDEWTFKCFCTTLNHYSMTQHKEKHGTPSEHQAALLCCAGDWAPAWAHPERLCILLFGGLQKSPGYGPGHLVLGFSGGVILWLFLGFYQKAGVKDMMVLKCITLLLCPNVRVWNGDLIVAFIVIYEYQVMNTDYTEKSNLFT